MSLIINCEWLCPAAITFLERCREVAKCVATGSVARVAGQQWFLKSGSKKQARRSSKTPVTPGAEELWSADPGDEFRVLALWNGQFDEREAASLRLELSVAPEGLNFFTLSCPDPEALRARNVAWDEVLSSARDVGNALGGVATVRVTELADEVGSHPLGDECAAFWGIDRAGVNPLHRAIAGRGVKPPCETVAIRTWAEVRAPDARAMLALQELLTVDS